MLFACNQGDKPIDDNIQYEQNGTITVDEAKEQQKNLNTYLEERQIPSDSIPNHAWINIDDLEKYITWVKAKGAKDKLTVSGIRIYLGKQNPVDGTFSLFLAPTGRPNVSKGQVGSTSTVIEPSEDPDLDYSPENYVNTGKPPKTYPFQGIQ